jgi:hypothetical protein
MWCDGERWMISRAVRGGADQPGATPDTTFVPQANPHDKGSPIVSSKYATVCPEDAEWKCAASRLEGEAADQLVAISTSPGPTHVPCRRG